MALVAVQVTERKESPQDLTFGWTRAQLLGAFFNGIFLLALGLSILLQSIERFIFLQHVESPKLVLIVGCVGLTLNLVSAAFLHEHDHGDGHSYSHSHGDVENLSASSSTTHDHHLKHRHFKFTPSKHGMDLGILGVLIHILGDAMNNIGVIISALVIWLTRSSSRFYADPAVSLWIALIIIISALPLTKHSGKILIQPAPLGVKINDIKQDLESIPGIISVHEVHVWRLDQRKAIASAHVVVSDPNVESFMDKAKVITECLHAYGIHSATLQPELSKQRAADDQTSKVASQVTTARPGMEKCGVPCGSVCEELKCCK